jgi:hypothetical protein
VLEGVAVDVDVGESVEGDCVAVAVGVGVSVGLVVTVGESVVASLVDIVVVERDGDREVVVSVVVELAVVVGLGVVVTSLVLVEDEVAVISPVPVEPPQPARVTMKTSPITESKRRISSTLARSAIKFPTFKRPRQLVRTSAHNRALSRTLNEFTERSRSTTAPSTATAPSATIEVPMTSKALRSCGGGLCN